MPWRKMLAYVTGSVDQEIVLRNEFLAAENQILRSKIQGRLLLTDAEKDLPGRHRQAPRPQGTRGAQRHGGERDGGPARVPHVTACCALPLNARGSRSNAKGARPDGLHANMRVAVSFGPHGPTGAAKRPQWPPAWPVAGRFALRHTHDALQGSTGSLNGSPTPPRLRATLPPEKEEHHG